jgi:lactoylglutathione lyase
MSAPTRVLHTMIRVKDLKASLEFYTDVLGMHVLRRRDYEDGRFTLVYVGYEPESSGTVVELTHNWDQAYPYELGSGYGHIALGVEDLYGSCAEFEKKGAKITRQPGPMKNDPLEIAFLEDPDGYKVELIGLKSFKHAIAKNS